MKLRIQYCGACGYRRTAERLAAKIRDRLGIEAELVRGWFGVFRVWVDDRVVFDKRWTRGLLGKLGFGRIPPDEEIMDRLASGGA
jgi:selT/selW/selH-like putative selenoprotein